MSDYEDIRRQLVVNKHQLDAALEVHASILEDIGATCARLDSRTRMLKDELDRTEAGIMLDFRGDSGQKRTVDEMKALTARHRDRVRAFEAYEGSRLEWQRWERMYDAWKSRDFSTRALGKLFGDGYFANDSITGGTRQRVRELSYEAGREAMQKNRRNL